MIPSNKKLAMTDEFFFIFSVIATICVFTNVKTN